LNTVLVYFLPRVGLGATNLVSRSYLVSLVSALGVGLIFAWGAPQWAPALTPLLAEPWLRIAFVLSVAFWCIFTLQDSVLTGLRQTTWVPVENLLVAVLKIILLVVLAQVAPAYGLWASWMIPVALSLGPVNWLIFARFLPQRGLVSGGQAIAPRELVQHTFHNYVGMLCFLASTTLLPMIVTQSLGTRATAYFYIPWMLYTGLQLIPQNMALSFMVEASANRSRIADYYQSAWRQSLRLLLPLVALLLVGAPWLMALFGADYAAEGSTLLRILAVAILPNLYTALYLSLARVENRSHHLIVVQGAICLLTLGLTALFLDTFGITGVGLAWLAAQSLVAVVIWGRQTQI
jgi:O-antigen/teichoic acid export membrane protein